MNSCSIATRPGKWAAVAAIALLSVASLTAFAANRYEAPPFSLERLAEDGSGKADGSISLSDYKDQVVLVNFWATWCAPCVHELPSMQALRDSLQDQPFEILALNLGEDPDQIQLFLDNFETSLEFPILLRADFWVADDFSVQTMPTSILIDKNGKVVDRIVGPREWNSPEAINLVKALVAE